MAQIVKRYKMEVDCANCASKMENEISKIDGVDEANISFMTQTLVIKCDESKLGEIMAKAAMICKSIDSDAKILM